MKRDEIMSEVTDAAGESSKTPRLQNTLQEFDENFGVIGIVNFDWSHTSSKPLNTRRPLLEGASHPTKQKYLVPS